MMTVGWPRLREQGVVLTGMGMVTPLGLSAQETWRKMLRGDSGLGPITKFDASRCLTRIGGQLPKGFEAWEKEAFSRRMLKQTVRTARIMKLAAGQALEDSGLDLQCVDPVRCAVIMGTSGSSVRSPQDKPPPGGEKFKILREMINAIPGWITLDYGFQGPSYTVSAACASGSYAMALAYDLIRWGLADVVITGGVDTLLTENSILRGNFLQVLTRENTPEAMRPFDLKRSGFVLSDGGCAVVLESLEHAEQRGARIYARLLGYGTVSEAYNIFAPLPHGEAMARAMDEALNHAGIARETVGLIVANGTATVVNDFYETQAIKKVFGEHAYKLLVTAPKSMLGHTIGASGAIAACAGALALFTGDVPPTINYRNPDPDCDLDYVPNAARRVPGLQAALVNAFGFGGHNCCLVFAREPALGQRPPAPSTKPTEEKSGISDASVKA